MAARSPNKTILNDLWDSAGDAVNSTMPESKQNAPPMRIQVTNPSGSTATVNQAQTTTQTSLQPPTQNGHSIAEPTIQTQTQSDQKTQSESQPAPKAVEPPSLAESAAFSTLQMFHDLGLGGDSEDIFMSETWNTNISTLESEPLPTIQPTIAERIDSHINEPIMIEKKHKKKKKKRDMDMDSKNNEMSMTMEEMEEFMLPQEYQETTPRKENDVKDMDSYKEITTTDLDQFESMLENTEQLIEDMIDVCNYNGYGLDDNGRDEDMKIKETVLYQNINTYKSYVSEQLYQYNFNLSSNAIVDLMGVKHTLSFIMNNKTDGYKLLNTTDCCISSQGYVLYENKRLTPHYYFNVIDYRVRRKIDYRVAKIIRDYLRKGHFNMAQFFYPSNQSLKGITPILINHFEEQCKIFYKQPVNIIQNPYVIIVFPNHKSHIRAGIWSRSVTYFDNVIRGTMFQFIEKCCQESGYGIVLLNPNERHIESEEFIKTKPKFDDPKDNEFYDKTTETITIPRNESSFAHTMEMYKHFINPIVIQKWKCKLLLLSHCDGGNDIIHLLETQPEIHDHIIGIAMLDFYNWSLQEFTKKTKQIIEQKAAVYMSLYGSNESAYGLEPSAAKSPVTIFRTANKEKRYSPCYNTESVIRFFKSKIALNQQ